MLKKLSAFTPLSLCLALTGCGGGGGDTPGIDPYLTKLRATAVGTSSTSSISGLTVDDISECNASNSGQAHVIPVCVDDGVRTKYRFVNRPSITVRLCTPGKYSETDCVNVDHVLVDTGSAGLRIATRALVKRLALPSITDNNKQPLAECMRFVSGWTWGSLNAADVYVGGLVARNVSLQMMGHSSLNPQLGGNGGGAFPNVPTDCSASDRDITDITQEGIQGIIGLSASAFNQHYGDQYFVCPNGVCVNTSNFDLNKRPGHLSVYMDDFKGGVVLSFPRVSSSGTRNLLGTLTFGIASLPTNASRIRLNPSGQFTTTFNGQDYPQSYIDSGSNSFFFDAPSSVSLPQCSETKGFYCPITASVFTATMKGLLNTTSTVTFSAGNVDVLASLPTQPNTFNNLSGPITTAAGASVDPNFAWGFPFFVGRTVYTVMEETALGGLYGSVAFTTP